MSLASIKDQLARALELELEDGPNMLEAVDPRSNCSMCVRLTRGQLVVLMSEDDALPLSTSYGRMTVSGHPTRLRVRNPSGGIELFPVTKCGRTADGDKVVAYKGADTDPEQVRIVTLMVAVFNKAAQRYSAA